MISISVFQSYFYAAVPRIPWLHWAVMVIISAAAMMWVARCKKYPVYGIVMLGLAVLFSLFLLDALVVTRIGHPHYYRSGLDLAAEYRRLLEGDQLFWVYLLFNIAAFIPFGFLVLWILSVFRGECSWGLTILMAFGLSLLVESLQWILRIGFFEVTDMVLNTLGAAIGAAIASGMRALVQGLKKSAL